MAKSDSEKGMLGWKHSGLDWRGTWDINIIHECMILFPGKQCLYSCPLFKNSEKAYIKVIEVLILDEILDLKR